MKIPHPIPYQGSKRYLASQILSYFPTQIDRVIEPCAGSAAITLAACTNGLASRYHLNDLNEPLIALWKQIINSPGQISRKYEKLWEAQHSGSKKHYYAVRKKFNETGRPDYFLYLLTRCVKAAVRYNPLGEFNQSPDNRRFGTHPTLMKKRIFTASKLLKNKTEFSAHDYTDVVKIAQPNDLVYFDPPYQGVCTNRNSRYFQGIDYEELISVLETLNQRNISFLVSYDGKTGNKKHGKMLPEKLELFQVKLKAGRSSQATLLGRSRNIYESLYISRALQERLIRSQNLAKIQ